MGRLYVSAWRDAYPTLLPAQTLLAMSEARAARQFEASIARSREVALVACSRAQGVVGLATGGWASDRGIVVAGRRIRGELFTLYVDPYATEQGIGRRLLQEALRALVEKGHESAIVWVLRGNPARFFYQHLGAKLVATKREKRFGTTIELEAYAWPDLAKLTMGRLS
jgi:ribosomal protein S18 acetylase RimI-like enzyme